MASSGHQQDRSSPRPDELRIWTVPNGLSLLRLLGIPLFLWLVLVKELDLLAFAVLVLAGVSDWLDGYAARRLGQSSRIGALLDPLVDRLYIAATLIGLGIRGIVGWSLVLILVLRDVVLLVLWPTLRRRGVVALPVTFVGKAGTFALLWGFPVLLLGTMPGTFGTVVTAVGWAWAIWGTYLYWWAGCRYAHQMLRTTQPA